MKTAVVRSAFTLLVAMSFAFNFAVPSFADDSAPAAEVSSEVSADSKAKTKKTKKTRMKLAANDGDGKTEEKKEKKEKDNKDSKDSKDGGKKDPAKKASSSKGGDGGGWGARLTSFTTGVVVGVPICMARRTYMEIIQGTKDLVGDTDNWFLLAPAGVVATPYGCVSGSVGGVLYGIKNSWTGSADEPFGPDSFSLGDMSI